MHPTNFLVPTEGKIIASTMLKETGMDVLQRHVAYRGEIIAVGPGRGQLRLVDVRGENAKRRDVFLIRGQLVQKDGQGVDHLTGGASAGPDPDLPAPAFPGPIQKAWQDDLLKQSEGQRVAKKFAVRDPQSVAQGLRLNRVLLQSATIGVRTLSGDLQSGSKRFLQKGVVETGNILPDRPLHGVDQLPEMLIHKKAFNATSVCSQRVLIINIAEKLLILGTLHQDMFSSSFPPKPHCISAARAKADEESS